MKCETCDGMKIVNAPWPSGYPHAFPCPACCPNTPCACGASNCPGLNRIVEWKAQQTKTSAQEKQ